MSTMRAAVWVGPDRVEVRDVPRPVVPEGWALVRTAYSGLCGTDLSIIHGTHPRAVAPLILGHELSGWVTEAGSGGPAEGAQIAGRPLITCGSCRACRTGHGHVCRNLGLFGIDAPGGMAEYVALPPGAIHEVPGSVDVRVAALAEPLAVAVHAVRLSGIQDGDTVAVFGAGPIGVLTALLARRAGAAQIVVSDPSAERRRISAGLGLTVVPDGTSMTTMLADLTDGEGADTTFDSAAHPVVAAEIAAATRVLGRIVVVGVYKQPAALDLQALCFKEQSMIGVRVYARADFEHAIELLTTGILDAFPARAFELGDVSAAVEATGPAHDHLKVLLTPWLEKADT